MAERIIVWPQGEVGGEEWGTCWAIKEEYICMSRDRKDLQPRWGRDFYTQVLGVPMSSNINVRLCVCVCACACVCVLNENKEGRGCDDHDELLY